MYNLPKIYQQICINEDAANRKKWNKGANKTCIDPALIVSRLSSYHNKLCYREWDYMYGTSGMSKFMTTIVLIDPGENN